MSDPEERPLTDAEVKKITERFQAAAASAERFRLITEFRRLYLASHKENPQEAGAIGRACHVAFGNDWLERQVKT